MPRWMEDSATGGSLMTSKEVRKALGATVRATRARVAQDFWPLLQATAAATAAWAIALQFGDDRDPFFAPVAAVIALNAERGERGRNALRLLSGVFIGIITAELTLVLLGGGHGGLALATFLATVTARAVGGARIVMAQAAAAAILTVATSAGEGGIERLVDASIGAAVSLVFTQILFSPEPVALVRRAESAALVGLGEGLGRVADALERDDDELATSALAKLRGVRDQLSGLARMRKASGRVVRRSLVWRSRAAPVVRERENAAHLDLLANSCVLLARTTAFLETEDRHSLAPSVKQLADAIGTVAEDLSEREHRQNAADCALELARWQRDHEATTTDTMAASIALRLVAIDVMVFAGVDHEVAVAAADEGTGELPIATPQSAPKFPFRLRRQPRR